MIYNNIENVEVDLIDLSDDYFSVSKPLDEKLVMSIEKSGVLNYPVLLKTSDKYRIISGVNRLNVAKEFYKTVHCYVIESVDKEFFINLVLDMIYNDRVGPIGKVKFLHILHDYFNVEIEDLYFLSAKGLSLSDKVYNYKYINEVLTFPGELKLYFDSKNVSFKIIKKIFSFDFNELNIISEWINLAYPSLSSFKNLIDLLSDIKKRDGDILLLKNTNLEIVSNKKDREQYLNREVFKIRYPEYAKKKAESEFFLQKLSLDKYVKLQFPKYFEGNKIILTIEIDKNNSSSDFYDKLDFIKSDNFRNLMNML